MTAPTTPDAARVYRVLDTARAHGTLGMGSWAQQQGCDASVTLAQLTGPECGTTACLAGWTAADAGYAVQSNGAVYNDHGGYVGHVENVAASLLGITSEVAEDLFYSTESTLDIVVGTIFGPRPEPTS